MDNVIPFPRRKTTGAAPEPLWRDRLGAQVRRERHRRRERIVDVAARAGIAPQYLSELERGRKDPSSEVLAAVAGALDLTTRQLVARAAGAPVETPRGPVCLAA